MRTVPDKPGFGTELVVIHAMVRGKLDDELQRFRDAGFVVAEHQHPFADGLLCGFVNLWPQYLELIAVTDAHAFAVSDVEALKLNHQDLRPRSVELVSQDTKALRSRLSASGWELPPLEEVRIATTPAEQPPDFTFQELPELAGPLSASVYTSSQLESLLRPIQISDGGVFALSEVTFIVDDPSLAASRWAELIEPAVVLPRLITASQWKAESGLDLVDGEVAEITLLALDETRLAERMLGLGWQREHTARSGQVLRHPADGLRFRLITDDPERWRDERAAVTGRRLEIQSQGRA